MNIHIIKVQLFIHHDFSIISNFKYIYCWQIGIKLEMKRKKKFCFSKLYRNDFNFIKLLSIMWKIHTLPQIELPLTSPSTTQTEGAKGECVKFFQKFLVFVVLLIVLLLHCLVVTLTKLWACCTILGQAIVCLPGQHCGYEILVGLMGLLFYFWRHWVRFKVTSFNMSNWVRFKIHSF